MNLSPPEGFAEGECGCGAARFRMNAAPMYTHCCHCTRCQRQNGSAFAINAIVESTAVEVLRGDVETASVPTESGNVQEIVRCTRCKTALWSHYGRLGKHAAFIRVGALDDPTAIRPDIHIHAQSKVPWVTLPPGDLAVPEYYPMDEYWPAESWQRLAKAKEAAG